GVWQAQGRRKKKKKKTDSETEWRDVWGLTSIDASGSATVTMNNLCVSHLQLAPSKWHLGLKLYGLRNLPTTKCNIEAFSVALLFGDGSQGVLIFGKSYPRAA
ncbi:unnamed protein product, partial [Ectocarpus sp. 12 AP-2014]